MSKKIEFRQPISNEDALRMSYLTGGSTNWETKKRQIREKITDLERRIANAKSTHASVRMSASLEAYKQELTRMNEAEAPDYTPEPMRLKTYHPFLVNNEPTEKELVLEELRKQRAELEMEIKDLNKQRLHAHTSKEANQHFAAMKDARASLDEIEKELMAIVRG